MTMDAVEGHGRGRIFTFYSYKGGVGRSMALANVAALLARWGKRVLIVDWDLEAPGIEEYFRSAPLLDPRGRRTAPGIVDLVTAYAEGRELDWKQCLIELCPFDAGSTVSILPAGERSGDYVTRVQRLDWERLFAERGLSSYVQRLRREWMGCYDFILIDSRTGITDIGGICTIDLPDVLVLLFTTNEQSIAGCLEVMERARKARQTLPYDRGRLLGIPVPSRDESRTEYKQAVAWRASLADRLAPIYADWMPRDTSPADILEKLRIPYIPYWSFGERMPVVEGGTSDPTSLGFAYGILAVLIAEHLDWRAVVSGDLVAREESALQGLIERAEELVEGQPQRQEELRRLFTSFVVPAPPGERRLDQVRPVPLGQLEELGVAELLDGLVEAKLLTREHDAGRDEDFIRLGHVGLAHGWQRLRDWVDANRDFLLWRERVRDASRLWSESGGQRGYLLRGSLLDDSLRRVKQREEDVDGPTRSFIQASRRRRRLLRGVGVAALLLLAGRIAWSDLRMAEWSVWSELPIAQWVAWATGQAGEADGGALAPAPEPQVAAPPPGLEVAVPEAEQALPPDAPAEPGELAVGPEAEEPVAVADVPPIEDAGPAPEAAVEAAPVEASPGAGARFYLQLASLPASDAAAELRTRLATGHGTLLPVPLFVQPAQIPDRGTFFRVRAGPIADPAEANEICRQLRELEQDCLVFRAASPAAHAPGG